MSATENCAPQAACTVVEETKKPALLELLQKLTKSRAQKDGVVEQVRAALRDDDWELRWQALKAAKKAGLSAQVVDLLIDQIDIAYKVPDSKRTYFERALDGVVASSGRAIVPYVDGILSRALAPAANWACEDDEEFERRLHSGGAAQMALLNAAPHLTQAHAESAFDRLGHESAEVRAAALDVATGAMERFAGPVVPTILELSHDKDEIVRATAVDALARCMGHDWQYSKGRGIATSRTQHEACAARVLEMRGDSSNEVLRQVADALEVCAYPGDDAKVEGATAKRARQLDASASADEAAEA